VPVKRLATAKTRLVSLDAATRQDLALAFALDTVAAALAADSVGAVVVVTDDDRAAAALSELGARIEPDRPDAGLNPALAHGAEVAALARPDLGVGALSSDLPALRAAELDLALTAGADHATAMVSDRSGLGTTLLLARSPADFEPRFGPRSRAAHRAAGVTEPALGASVPSLRGDVDTEVDLWEAERLGLGPRTSELLASRTR
jgi:2-phospho-L-lactate guanylyltransferase